jgi:hypothetical protein
MPWKVIAKGGQYLVVKADGSGKVVGRHSTRAKALRQLRAIYSNYGKD